MNQENLLNKIRQKDAKAFTHGGKFHADDIFSSALLLYLNPEIQITRGNQVRKSMTVLYLTSDGEHMTIIRRTAVSGKTGFHMRHSDFCGKS